jgi:Uncharacterized protein conserved in bacteria (DUF2317).
MDIERIELPPRDLLVRDYLLQMNDSLFHYHFLDPDSDRFRLRELGHFKFPRERLAEHIRSLMEPFGLSEEIEDSLVKLARPDSAVIVGGQQAGILGGPLYTIYKMISVIILAKEKEEKLGIPVVPVFWIAGEDHDFAEVNHVFIPDGTKMAKKIYQSRLSAGKQMVSRIEIDRESLISFCEEVVRLCGETEHSKILLEHLRKAAKRAGTISEFFLSFVHRFFKSTGLLFLDSAHPDLRQLEKDYFCWMVEKSGDITKALIHRQRELAGAGYYPQIEADPLGAQLFYVADSGRQPLLVDRETGDFQAGGKKFSRDRLLSIALHEPERLSNNVATRPLMQEFLMPVLGFVGGPGEIHYWSELKECFELFERKIPPIYPRLNITLLERHIESALDELGLDLTRVLLRGAGMEKERAEKELLDPDIRAVISRMKQRIEEEYRVAKSSVSQRYPELDPILEKNEHFIVNQLDFILRKAEEASVKRNRLTVDKYDRVESSLHPFGEFQERCWNIIYFLNRYGLDFIHRLFRLPLRVDGGHFIVRI